MAVVLLRIRGSLDFARDDDTGVGDGVRGEGYPLACGKKNLQQKSVFAVRNTLFLLRSDFYLLPEVAPISAV